VTCAECGRSVRKLEVSGRWMHDIPFPAVGFREAVVAGGTAAVAAKTEWGREIGMFILATAHNARPKEDE